MFRYILTKINSLNSEIRRIIVYTLHIKDSDLQNHLKMRTVTLYSRYRIITQYIKKTVTLFLSPY